MVDWEDYWKTEGQQVDWVSCFIDLVVTDPYTRPYTPDGADPEYQPS